MSSWTLKNDAAIFILPSDIEQIKVGRQEECFVRILDDQSVSRIHAILYIKDGRLFVSDCSSKFGTFLNDFKLAPSDQKEMVEQDIIKFGAVNSIFKVTRCPNIVLKPPSIVEIATALVEGRSLNGFKARNIERRTMFNGYKFKPNSLNSLIEQCGGTISENGDEWSEEEILDAIIYGKLKSKVALSFTVVAEYILPKLPKMASRVQHRTEKINFKQFRRVQQSSLPDIIGTSDMVVHNSANSMKAPAVQIEHNLPLQPIHENFRPAKPIEQYFGSPPPIKHKHVKTTIEQDFQTDFFKNLL